MTVHQQGQVPKQETLSWRALLTQILKNRNERARMAGQIGVTERTLARWTLPQYKLPEVKRELLLDALPPSYRATFENLMRKEAQPSIQDMLTDSPSPTDQHLRNW